MTDAPYHPEFWIAITTAGPVLTLAFLVNLRAWLPRMGADIIRSMLPALIACVGMLSAVIATGSGLYSLGNGKDEQGMEVASWLIVLSLVCALYQLAAEVWVKMRRGSDPSNPTTERSTDSGPAGSPATSVSVTVTMGPRSGSNSMHVGIQFGDEPVSSGRTWWRAGSSARPGRGSLGERSR